jgi:hypothetical protein
MDMLDLLSNECLQSQTKFEFIFEDLGKKSEFMKEIKVFLKSKVSIIQRKKMIPIYSNFLEPPSFQIEYCVLSDHRFNVLYIKENNNGFFIQRIYFSIDI